MARTGDAGLSVLVTGASGGIGSRLVQHLDGLGHRVFAGMRGGLGAVVLPDRVVPVELDVTDEASVAAAVERVRVSTGGAGLDGLVNCAGIIVQGPVELVSTEALRRQFEVNVIGPMTLTRAFLPDLRNRRGRIVNVGAATGRTAVPFLGPISASKAALASLSDALRMELKLLGVDVVLVEPGAMDTAIFDKADRLAAEDLDRSPAASRAVYRPAMAASAAALGGAKRRDPDVAVEAIIKALTDRRPSPRSLAGGDARTLSALRWMPVRTRDRLLMRGVGLSPSVFATDLRGRPAEVSS